MGEASEGFSRLARPPPAHCPETPTSCFRSRFDEESARLHPGDPAIRSSQASRAMEREDQLIAVTRGVERSAQGAVAEAAATRVRGIDLARGGATVGAWGSLSRWAPTPVHGPDRRAVRGVEPISAALVRDSGTERHSCPSRRFTGRRAASRRATGQRWPFCRTRGSWGAKQGILRNPRDPTSVRGRPGMIPAGQYRCGPGRADKSGATAALLAAGAPSSGARARASRPTAAWRGGAHAEKARN
jgi:hypothetical protein